MAANLTLGEIRRYLADADRIPAAAFDILSSLCIYVSSPDTEQRGQDLLLRALEQREAFGSAASVLDGLVRHVGLFPYLEPEQLTLADTIAYEFHRPDNMDADGVVFHRVQAQVYDHLLSGDNVVLSAPTSFGKSLIIDAVIASGRYKNIVLVVPTIALIDETRRRLSRFSGQFKIITHGSQRRADKSLLIMTQERVLEQDPIGPVDFFVLDEFYKLQPRTEDTERSLLLNEAFYKLYKTGAQFYLLGPNIRGLDTGVVKRVNLRFIKTDYKTVASEIHHVKPEPDDEAALVSLCSQLPDATLIYCSSPARVRKVAEALLQIQKEQPDLKDAVEWIGAEYSPDWLFGKALGHGIGMHHGRLPRTLSQFVVRSFNEGFVRFLICTSTLIEGVNTKAKNVIIFDNKVARRKFDYFTYNNILGRSGRMFQHFVGHVYIFHEPPAEDLPFVDIPALTQPDNTPDSLLMQLESGDLSPAARDRMSQLTSESELDLDTLRSASGIDPRAQNNLAREIRTRASYYWPLLRWSGYPTWEQLEAVCTLIWTFLIPDNRMRSGVASGRQMAYKIDRFRRSQSLSAYLHSELTQRAEESADEVMEDTIDFLRSWANFAFPRYLLVVDRIQKAVFAKLKRPFGDYGFFAGQVENWFIDPALMALDEYGIPVQVSQKLAQELQPQGDLDSVLQRLRDINVDRLPLSTFEKSLVIDAKKHL
jgi:hypothetical protein